MKYSILTISALALTIGTVACGGKGDKAADSAKLAEEAEKEEILVELPDTAYESVKLINATTTIVDESTSGKLNNLADLYNKTPGVFAFRKNSRSDADMFGTVKGTPSDIVVDWEYVTGSDNRTTGSSRGWGGGSGWTGQPVYVEWPDSMIQRYKQKGHLKEGFSGKEIIVGSLGSHVYFIDFNTGKDSRQAINVFNPIKGSISLDPSMNGNIYVGHGIPNERPFGHVVVNLDEHAVTDRIGEDKGTPRAWGAYDSSAIRHGQFLFRPGENGRLYKYLIEPGKLKLHSTMDYKVPSGGPGMEASLSIYRNYGYTADNHGYLVCTNLNTMKPVWVYNMGDDTDSSPVVQVEDGVPYIYTGSEVDRTSTGETKFVKLNALTGEPVWEKMIPAKRWNLQGTVRHFDGGFYGTTLPGRGNCKDLIFNHVVKNTSGQNGAFIAMDRKTGEIKYETPTKRYAWSSPVGFMNEKDEMFILTADCAGNMYIINGADGQILATKTVGHNFESSPVVSGNSAVVGSRGSTIYKASLK